MAIAYSLGDFEVLKSVMKLRVVFANMYQGMHFAGEKDGEDVFFGYRPDLHLEFIKSLNPDILCLAEMPFDSEDGSGKFRQELETSLEFRGSEVYVSDKSWIITDKFYGSGIFAKQQFADYKVTTLPNPKLEIDRPDGSHWVMHDKALQQATLQLGDVSLKVSCLHYYPVHHFGRKITEPEFTPIRQALANLIKPEPGQLSIVTGDFNNKNTQIEVAFPEIFANGEFKKAVEYDRNEKEKYYEGDGIQIDHILYSQGLNLVQADVLDKYSDHATIVVELNVD
jgi:endonuclease/exonuclease/phosphatase family metal-dependent hydrolase